MPRHHTIFWSVVWLAFTALAVWAGLFLSALHPLLLPPVIL